MPLRGRAGAAVPPGSPERGRPCRKSALWGSRAVPSGPWPASPSCSGPPAGSHPCCRLPKAVALSLVLLGEFFPFNLQGLWHMTPCGSLRSPCAPPVPFMCHPELSDLLEARFSTTPSSVSPQRHASCTVSISIM